MINKLPNQEKIDEIAAGCLIYSEKRNKFLIIKKTKNQQWGFPKGRTVKEEGNDLISTARREVKEETNLDVLIDEAISAECTYEMDKKGTKFLRIYFAVAETEEIIFGDGELESSEWLSSKDYLARISSAPMKSVAEELFSKIKANKGLE